MSRLMAEPHVEPPWVRARVLGPGSELCACCGVVRDGQVLRTEGRYWFECYDCGTWTDVHPEDGR
jgi:hypothetical protein